MPTRSFGSVRVSYPDHSREELIALLREGIPALAGVLPLRRVTLFGSWARGRATAHSDIDLLVIYDGDPREDAYVKVRRAIRLRGLEPHVYTAAEAASITSTLERMTRDGVELFEADRLPRGRVSLACPDGIRERMVAEVETGEDSRREPVRLLQVGLGGFGRSWAAEVVPSVHGAVLAGCVDVDPAALEGARSLTSLHADRYFSSLEDALAATEADAVLITAPLQAHVPAALAALEAGKHVLMEKPFAPSLGEAQTVVDSAAARGLVMMISQNYRFFPAVRAVTSLVERGSLGAVDAVHVDFRRFDNAAPAGAHRHYRFPQPMVVDMGIHHFDLMRLVLGREPIEVYCRAWNPPWSKYEEPAEMMAVVRFEGDVMVSYRGSWLSSGEPTPWAGEWRMELSDGEIAWTSRDGKPIERADAVMIRQRGETAERLVLPSIRYVGRAGSLDAFIRAIRTGDEPETSGRENLKTLALTLAAVESAQTQRPVLLRPPPVRGS